MATFFVAFAWAYSCVAIRIAWLARSQFGFASEAEFAQVVGTRLLSTGTLQAELPNALRATIFRADYVETGSSVVFAVFYAVFCGGALALRSFIGPSPYVTGLILSLM